MKILVLKTNIQTPEATSKLQRVFNNNPKIVNWTVDLEDVDKVLRMEVLTPINEDKIVSLLKLQGIFGEDLKY